MDYTNGCPYSDACRVLREGCHQHGSRPRDYPGRRADRRRWLRHTGPGRTDRHVTKMLQQATARPHMQGLYTAEQVDDEFESMIERGGVKAVPTGIVTLDRMLGGGFHQDELIIVGARPSVGKSWFALQLRGM
jgi:predicted ATP-dependent serine protease